MNKTKLLGQTFTEYSEVSKMLAMYKGDILESKIMEPSFGDGAFLCEIVRKIVEKARLKKMDDLKIKSILEKNIWGFEIDTHFFDLALKNLSEVLKNLDFSLNVKFTNLKNETAFNDSVENFDLIIGNPPYVRVQNFDNGISEVRKQLKRTGGNTDLYLMFIDFYLEKLSKNGELIFIVPNSLGKSKAAFELRKWMFENGSIDYIDFEDQQLFATASVYSCIFKFKKNSIEQSWFKVKYAGKKMKLDGYKVFEPKIQEIKIPDLGVKNGIATLSDSIFIFKNNYPSEFEKEQIVRVYKASRMEDKYFAIFPYKFTEDGITRFKSDEEFRIIAPKIFKYLLENKDKLLKRSLENGSKWFEYGRSQAINDVNKQKIVIDTLIRPNDTHLSIKKIPAKTLVFSGLYTTSDLIEEFNSVELINSLRFRAKDMRGGYKKISSSLLKNEKY